MPTADRVVEDPATADETIEDPVVELVDVHRRYRLGGAEVAALDGVTLRVGRGELVVVLGPSGSGKTTLLNVIGALDAPTSGSVRVAGRQLAGANRRDQFRLRRETVSFVFQAFNLFPGLTALENVAFGADVAGAHPGVPPPHEILARVGLGDRLHHFPHQLSGGEQQRVAIARALATGNPVLLADEPTGELDHRTGVQILELLAAQAEAGVTVVIVTHNRAIAAAADRVVELSGGRVVRDGPPAGGRVPLRDLRW